MWGGGKAGWGDGGGIAFLWLLVSGWGRRRGEDRVDIHCTAVAANVAAAQTLGGGGVVAGGFILACIIDGWLEAWRFEGSGSFRG